MKTLYSLLEALDVMDKDPELLLGALHTSDDDEDDLMDEESTVDGAGAYDVPGAFGNASPKTKYQKGWQPATQDPKLHAKMGESTFKQMSSELFLSEARYSDFVEEGKEKSPSKHIHSAIVNVNKQLRILEKLIDHSIKYKSSSKVDSRDLSKTTHDAIVAIQTKLYKLNAKLNDLSS